MNEFRAEVSCLLRKMLEVLGCAYSISIIYFYTSNGVYLYSCLYGCASPVDFLHSCFGTHCTANSSSEPVFILECTCSERSTNKLRWYKFTPVKLFCFLPYAWSFFQCLPLYLGRTPHRVQTYSKVSKGKLCFQNRKVP